MSLSKIFLSIGIAVIFTAFAAYALNVVYPAPEYDYSANDCYLKYDCYAQVRECESKYYNASTVPAVIPKGAQECSFNITQTGEYKHCQKESTKCNEEFQIKSPQYAHAKNTFVILLIIGIAAIMAGSRIMRIEGVSSGLIGGGVLTILWSLISSWMYIYNLDKYFKLLGLGVALAVLIYIAYKKFDWKK